MITVKLNGSAKYFLVLSCDYARLEVPTMTASLDEMISIGRHLIMAHNFEHVNVCDGDTGEVVAELDLEQEEEKEDFDDYDCDNDCGYNPYLGAFDWDC